MTEKIVTAEAIRKKIYSHQIRDLNLGLENAERICPSLDYLNAPKDKNALIIVEGCSGVGKTHLVDFLSMMLRFPVYQQIDFHWDITNCWSEFLAVSQLYNTKLKLIQDRSIPSWRIYHNAHEWIANIWNDWLLNLSRWDFAVVIWLYSDANIIMQNIKNKNETYDRDYDAHSIIEEQENFGRLVHSIPENLRIEKYIEEYSNTWMWQIYEQILGRMTK